MIWIWIYWSKSILNNNSNGLFLNNIDIFVHITLYFVSWKIHTIIFVFNFKRRVCDIRSRKVLNYLTCTVLHIYIYFLWFFLYLSVHTCTHTHTHSASAKVVAWERPKIQSAQRTHVHIICIFNVYYSWRARSATKRTVRIIAFFFRRRWCAGFSRTFWSGELVAFCGI